MITPFSLGGRGSRQLSKALEECRKNSREHSPAAEDIWVLCTNNPICVAKYIAPSQDSTSTVLIQPMKSSSYDIGLLIPCDGQLILAKRENIQSIQMIQEPGGWRIADTPRIRRLIQMLSVRGINFSIPVKLGNGQQLINGNDKENWDMVSLESSDFDEGSVESSLFQHLVHAANNNSTDISTNNLLEKESLHENNYERAEKILVESPNHLAHLTPVSVTELSKSPVKPLHSKTQTIPWSNSPPIIFPTSSVRTPSPNMIFNSLLSSSNISTKSTSRKTPYMPSRTVTKFIAGKPISSNCSTSSPSILPSSVNNFQNNLKNTNVLDGTFIAVCKAQTCEDKILNENSGDIDTNNNTTCNSNYSQDKQMGDIVKKRRDNHLDSLQTLFIEPKSKSKTLNLDKISEISTDETTFMSNEISENNIETSTCISQIESIISNHVDNSTESDNNNDDKIHIVVKSNRRKRCEVELDVNSGNVNSRPVRSARMERSSYAQRNAIFGSWPTRLQSAEKGSWKM